MDKINVKCYSNIPGYKTPSSWPKEMIFKPVKNEYVISLDGSESGRISEIYHAYGQIRYDAPEIPYLELFLEK